MTEQAVGRVQRWKDEEGMELDERGSWNDRKRFIFDFVDQHTVAASQYYSASRQNDRVIPGRKAIYEKAGYKIISNQKPRSLKPVEDKAAALAAKLKNCSRR